MDLTEERSIREEAMRWLDDRAKSTDLSWVSYVELRDYHHGSERLALMDRQRGIRKPAHMNAALSIRTTYTKPGEEPPYADHVGEDGLQRYKYQGQDPNNYDNRALRTAMEHQLPIIWFIGIDKGLFEPIYPVWVIAEEPAQHQFVIVVGDDHDYVRPEASDIRRYSTRIARTRLHQPVFRARVLHAYGTKCSICRLKHPELLDAAHIIQDGRPHGEAIVPNGISLCKIHHAAFDANIVGIRPDLTLHVRPDVLDEVDGWMLKGGIQGIHDRKLDVLPMSRLEWPDPFRLEERYATFQSH